MTNANKQRIAEWSFRIFVTLVATAVIWGAFTVFYPLGEL